MGVMCTCDPRYNATASILTKFNIKLDGVYHCGSSDAIEADTWDLFGAKYVIYFEVNDLVFNYLIQRLSGRPNHMPFLYGLGDIDEEKTSFHYYRELTDGAGSIFEDDKMHEYVSDCHMLGISNDDVLYTLDTIIDRHQIPYLDTNLLNIDLQGAELKCLRGCKKLLTSPSLKYIICETSIKDIYKYGPKIEDIDNELKLYNFERVYYQPDPGMQGSQGDSLYIRK
jgi:FkbM family methyltransferase